MRLVPVLVTALILLCAPQARILAAGGPEHPPQYRAERPPSHRPAHRPGPPWPARMPAPPEAADFVETETEWVALGRLLFFDPFLSGNDNIAGATCHHPDLGTADAMSLSIGEGGHGLDAARRAGPDNLPRSRIPRHAPALWNLGAREFVTMFHDGCVAPDPTAAFGIRMPEGRSLERPVATPLAAQTMLPLLSAAEMAGHPGENPIADAVARDHVRGPGGAGTSSRGRSTRYRAIVPASTG